MNQRLPIGWIVFAALVTGSAIPLLNLDLPIGSLKTITLILIALIWLFPILLFAIPERMQRTGHALTELRVAVGVSFLLTILLLIIIVLLWGIYIVPEFSLFTFSLFIYIVAIQWAWGNDGAYRQRVAAAFDGNRIANMMISVLSIILMFAVVELTMRFTTIQPDGFAVTLQFTTWYNRYFKPINSLGFRGYEPVAPEGNHESVLILGDSFAIGHGINNIDDVFAYQLGDILGDDYVVNLNAHIGISPNVAEWLEPYPVQPDILILSHFINDIEHVEVPGQATYGEFAPEGLTKWFTQRYFLASFVYWHIYVGPRMLSLYADELISAYDVPEKWEAHEARLADFVDWAEANDARLIVLVWPVLSNLEASADADELVVDFFRDNDIEVINMREVLSDLSVQERSLNSFDAHPSLLSHRLAAEALAELIRESN